MTKRSAAKLAASYLRMPTLLGVWVVTTSCADILGLDAYGVGSRGGDGSTAQSTTQAMVTATTVTGGGGGLPASGTLLSARAYGGSENDEGWGVSFAPSGDMYLSGKTVSPSGTSLSVGKLDSNGTPVWTKDYLLGPQDIYTYSFRHVSDETGVIFGGTSTIETKIEGQPVAGSFVAKLAPDGSLAWVQSCGGQISFESQAPGGGIAYVPLAGNPRGAVVLTLSAHSGFGCGTSGSGLIAVRLNASTGDIISGLTFGSDTHGHRVLAASTVSGGTYLTDWSFTFRFSATGSQIWGQSILLHRFGLAYDATTDGVVVVGSFPDGTINLGGGDFVAPNQGFWVRYAPDSTYVRHGSFGNPGTGRTVVTDEVGNLYFGVGFGGSADFGDGQPLAATGASDGAIVKLDKDSKVLWKHYLKGANFAEINGMALGPTGKLAVFGTFDTDLTVNGDPIPLAGQAKDVFLIILQR